MKDEVVKAVRVARAEHAKTPKGQYEKLLAEELRWRRKLTIASNKLENVRYELMRFTWELLGGRK